jgi:putative DNA primase/helicase
MEHPRKLTVKPEPLPDELLPVAPFDFELMPESLRPWVMDICERMQCPPEFVAVPVIVSLGAVIGRKVGIRPQNKTDWTVTANQWGMIVGRPGVLKSPSLEAALFHLKRLTVQANSAYQNELAEYEGQKIIAKLRQEAREREAKKALKDNPNADLKCPMYIEEPDSPVLRRYMANDTTPESLGELLRQNPNGILAFRDELVSLLKGLDREDRVEGRGFYLTGWNGDSAYTFDRIGRGLNMHIEAVCLSLLGGTQPGRLSEYIRHAVKGGSADDGLIQRFGLMVWPDASAEWKDVDRWPDNEAKNMAFQVYDMLDRLDPMAIGASQDTDIDGNPEGMPYLRFAPAALELFQEWRTKLEAMLRGDLHPALESHFAKYRKVIPSLALIIHLADGNHGPVTEEATLKALAWGEYLQTHARRAYASVSMPEVGVAKAILKRVKSGDLKSPFSSRDVWRPGWSKLTDRDQVVEALKMLEDYGWVTTDKKQTGGRTAILFHVHEEALR